MTVINAINANFALFGKYFFSTRQFGSHNHACQSSFSTSMILFKYFKKQSLPTSNKAELLDAARTILELRLELCVVGLWRQESVRQ